MNKIKKLKIALMSSGGLIVLTAILGFGMLAVAYTDYGAPKVVVEGDYIEAPAPAEQVEEEMLGGSGGVFQTDWYKVGNRVTFIKSGQFVDATTTILAFMNPFGVTSSTAAASNATHGLEQYALDFEGTDATSTVVNINLDITGVATTTFAVTCGAAANKWSAPTYDIMEFTYVTSTTMVLSNHQATTTAGYAAAVGSATTANVLLTHEYSYFTCVATGTPADGAHWGNDEATGGHGGLTGNSNTFDGYWSVEVEKNIQ